MNKLLGIFLSDKPKHQIISSLIVALLAAPFIWAAITYQPAPTREVPANYQKLQYEEIKKIRETLEAKESKG